MSQDSDFAKALGSDNFLDQAKDWIRGNLDPEDVFTDDQLENWALRGGWIQE